MYIAVENANRCLTAGVDLEFYTPNNSARRFSDTIFPISYSATLCICVACAQSFVLWQQATIEMILAISLAIANSRDVNNGFILHAHPLRGESHNQRNTAGEVATVSLYYSTDSGLFSGFSLPEVWTAECRLLKLAKLSFDLYWYDVSVIGISLSNRNASVKYSSFFFLNSSGTAYFVALF